MDSTEPQASASGLSGLLHVPFAFSFLLLLAAASAGAKPNALTPEERRQGFQLLFDGHSLQRWQRMPPLPPKAVGPSRMAVSFPKAARAS